MEKKKIKPHKFMNRTRFSNTFLNNDDVNKIEFLPAQVN